MIAYKLNIYGIKKNILLNTLGISHIHFVQYKYITFLYICKFIFFSQEFGINYAIRDVIIIVCELNFKLIFQTRNYIKESTHAIVINPSFIH